MTRCSRTSLAWFTVSLLAGCGSRSIDEAADTLPEIRPVANYVVSAETLFKGPPEPRLATLIPAAEAIPEPAPEIDPTIDTIDTAPEAPTPEGKYWAFPSEAPVCEDSGDPPVVVCLPPVAAAAPNEPSMLGDLDTDMPIASLLPPQAIDAEAIKEIEAKIETEPLASLEADLVVPEAEDAALPQAGAVLERLQDTFEQDASESEIAKNETTKATELSAAEQRLVDAVIRDCPAATTGVLTDQRIDELAKLKIRRAYALANRSAHYAARQELIEVLRMISRAKDAQQGVPKRTVALAAGLRALKESNDFAPRGEQLEAELAIDVICASHRTPVAKQPGSSNVLPQQMLDRYLRYAQLKLGDAVAGEPAGSMALHALGKLTSQLGKVEPDRHRLTQRHAIAFQQAALLAHSKNYLAAHELAVLLADSGHFGEAEKLLRQVAAREPNAIVLRNLVRVQEKLGLAQQAAANRAFARQLAQNGVHGTNHVQWLSPQAFARTSGDSLGFSTAMASPTASRPIVPSQPAVPTRRGPMSPPNGSPPNWR